MSRPKNREEFRRNLAEEFAAVLEEKGLEWKKEWNGGSGLSPYNGVTKAVYKGCNLFWLSLISMKKNYKDPRWVTMVQIMDKKNIYHPNQRWHLKAGSKATYVEYWFPYDMKNKKLITWNRLKTEIDNGRSKSEFRLTVRYTPVFNGTDIEGMPKIEVRKKSDISIDDMVRKLSQEMKVPIMMDGGDNAYYSVKEDKIHLPDIGCFDSEYAFNSTALHELSHSTGHPDRLNRDQSGRFGSGEYAYEELVAEISACFMGVNLAMDMTDEHISNHKAYVQSWARSIRKDPESLMKAIKDAQNASAYMDMKAGLINEKEYNEKYNSSVQLFSDRKREIER